MVFALIALKSVALKSLRTLGTVSQIEVNSPFTGVNPGARN